MKIDLFSAPIRKYAISNNQPHVDYWDNEYKQERFDQISPVIMAYPNVPNPLYQNYSDIMDQFMDEIGASDTHSWIFQTYVFKALEKGESTDRMDTLPSHYTLTHYISDCKKSDMYWHPIHQIIRTFDPGVNEWTDTSGVYVNQGDVIIHPSWIESNSPMNENPDLRMTLSIPVVIKTNEQS